MRRNPYLLHILVVAVALAVALTAPLHPVGSTVFLVHLVMGGLIALGAGLNAIHAGRGRGSMAAVSWTVFAAGVVLLFLPFLFFFPFGSGTIMVIGGVIVVALTALDAYETSAGDQRLRDTERDTRREPTRT